ncbi:MAG: hypothetical protein ACREI7_01660, partial [Myxococcota bacterium]
VIDDDAVAVLESGELTPYFRPQRSATKAILSPMGLTASRVILRTPAPARSATSTQLAIAARSPRDPVRPRR